MKPTNTKLPQEIIKSNLSCRSFGAVGSNAIVPKFVVEEYSIKNQKILDFGSGKEIIHTKKLRMNGYQVDAYEFGNNVNENHIKVLLPNKYDIVFASNVFNTHSNYSMSISALTLIYNTMKFGGLFVFNFPQKPNYLYKNFGNNRKFSDFKKVFIEECVEEIFGKYVHDNQKNILTIYK